MKKIVLLFSIFCCNLIFAQSRGPETVYYPTLEDPKSFSMIMVADPQAYVKFAMNQPLFEFQTAWIAQNIKRLNIKTALFTGDMVEQNNKLISKPLPERYNNGDQTSRQQWEAVSRALSRLDNKLPYVVCQGNHDVGYISAENRFSNLPEYVYPERNSTLGNVLVSTCANYQGVHTLENAAYEFHDRAWGAMLIIALEFAPRDEALEWARQLTQSPKYRNHKVFLLMHTFLNSDGERYETEGYKLTPRNWAQAIWDKLIYPSKNIRMVLCGHSGNPPKMNDLDNINYQTTTSYRVDKAADGHNVVQMMFNSQHGDGSWNGNGGDGWLRILEFKPDGKTIGVRTFSPFFAHSKRTQSLAWRTESYDQFEIVIE